MGDNDIVLDKVVFVVVVLGFYAPQTAEVIIRRDIGFKYQMKDCRSPG